MKGRLSQLEAYRSVRKPVPPPTRVERPTKGQGYRRRGRYRKDYGQED